jgi:DNA-binding transcriptional ArsR family regulator
MTTPTARDLDAVFCALADPTRRAIVERLLTAHELSAGEIARPFRISSPAISRHLRVLEEAGIVERRIDRQWRYVRIQPKALALAETWFAEQRRHRTGALDRLGSLVGAQTPKEKKS